MPHNPPTALVLYHYLYPDDVVSAIHFSDLCAGLVKRGWRVVGCASNRPCRDRKKVYVPHSVWNGVEFRRVWRPGLQQASGFGRLANAVWMIGAWSLLALDRRFQPDVLIVGTDPVLSPVVSMVWRILRPRVRLVHWCFDLYPEAAIADGVLGKDALPARLLTHWMRCAYKRFDLIVDIGSCMRERLGRYGSAAVADTIVPWALVEPDEPSPIPATERCEIFGDAKLGLLYSGSFGRAHAWRGILEIAKALRPGGGRVVFSARGNAVARLREEVTKSGAPVDFVEFATAEGLSSRLSAADIHVVSLREEWTGTVVPSKFFGALAIGRPVLFVGSGRSAIAKWIEQMGVGWVLDPERIEMLAAELGDWGQSPEAKARLFRHCHAVYRREFSQGCALDRWDRALRALVLGGARG